MRHLYWITDQLGNGDMTNEKLVQMFEEIMEEERKLAKKREQLYLNMIRRVRAKDEREDKEYDD